MNISFVYAELARKYGACEKTKVGNMVVKEFLANNGVDVGKFTSNHNAPVI